MTLTTLSVDTRRGSFFGISCGDGAHRLCLCLHGFPDNCETYSRLLPALAADGYYAVAVNLRGYAPSVLSGPFKTQDLAADVMAIADELSPGRQVVLVGHDIGGQVIYRVCANNPERVRAAVVLAAPHPDIIKRNARSLAQLWRSRYIILMQLRGVAEWWITRRNFRYIERLWQEWSPELLLPRAHLDSVKQTLRASMPAPVQMYRSGDFGGHPEAIMTPTLLLMGQRDGCVPPELAEGQHSLFSGHFVAEVIPHVGHFLHIESPTTISDRILRFLTVSHSPTGP